MRDVAPAHQPGMATGGRLEVKRATARIKRAEAVYLLAPRENLLFWLFHILQGKRDELILWITFQSKPEQEVEVARPGDRQFESRLKASDKKALTVSEGLHGFLFASEQKKGGALPQAERRGKKENGTPFMLSTLRTCGLAICRKSAEVCSLAVSERFTWSWLISPIKSDDNPH